MSDILVPLDISTMTAKDCEDVLLSVLYPWERAPGAPCTIGDPRRLGLYALIGARMNELALDQEEALSRSRG